MMVRHTQAFLLLKSKFLFVIVIVIVTAGICQAYVAMFRGNERALAFLTEYCYTPSNKCGT
jgi:hypothetical protein